jgi:hypothetical protein
VLPPGPPRLGDHRVALAPPLVERLERLPGGVWVDGSVDELEITSDGLAVLVGDVAHRRSDLVHDAGLHPGRGEDGLDRLGEAGEPIDAADQDVLDAALVEVVEDGQPELRALCFLPPDPEHVALASTVTPTAR